MRPHKPKDWSLEHVIGISLACLPLKCTTHTWHILDSGDHSWRSSTRLTCVTPSVSRCSRVLTVSMQAYLPCHARLSYLSLVSCRRPVPMEREGRTGGGLRTGSGGYSRCLHNSWHHAASLSQFLER